MSPLDFAAVVVEVTGERTRAVTRVTPDAPVGRVNQVLRTARHPVQTLGGRRVRWILFAGWLAVLALVYLLRGLPTGRLPLAGFIVTLLVITRVGHGRTALQRVILDWLPFTGVLLMYDGSRSLVARVGLPVHVTDVAHAESRLFGGVQPAVWLQQHLYDAAHPMVVHWYDAVCTLVYTSHFLATPIVAAILWVRDRETWLRFIRRVVALSLAGLVTYIAFPEAPPWLASKDGVIGPVARLSARGWIWLHAGHVNTLLAGAQSAGSNPVAAMPSLHTAFATLIALFLASRITSAWRYLLVLYPLAMAFTLVYCGEHYVLDLIAGVLYALLVHAGMTRWERWRAGRARARGPQADGGTGRGSSADGEPEGESALAPAVDA